MRIAIHSFTVVLILAAAMWLQVFLSKKVSKWLGLILPFISFAYSLCMGFSVAKSDGITVWNNFNLIMSTFLITNIPTITLLTIYFGCHKKKEK
ncbi:hypothetical protein [Lacrimispora indolis]|uniref:hypothetical protein n=1 Tax=Lacrimispora indolis TaxID=69825 RepID=UPI000686EEE0|nr:MULTISPECIES: hypothetical protein [Lachnospiraceae]